MLVVAETQMTAHLSLPLRHQPCNVLGTRDANVERGNEGDGHHVVYEPGSDRLGGWAMTFVIYSSAPADSGYFGWILPIA